MAEKEPEDDLGKQPASSEPTLELPSLRDLRRKRRQRRAERLAQAESEARDVDPADTPTDGGERPTAAGRRPAPTSATTSTEPDETTGPAASADSTEKTKQQDQQETPDDPDPDPDSSVAVEGPAASRRPETAPPAAARPAADDAQPVAEPDVTATSVVPVGREAEPQPASEPKPAAEVGPQPESEPTTSADPGADPRAGAGADDDTEPLRVGLRARLAALRRSPAAQERPQGDAAPSTDIDTAVDAPPPPEPQPVRAEATTAPLFGVDGLEGGDTDDTGEDAAGGAAPARRRFELASLASLRLPALPPVPARAAAAITGAVVGLLFVVLTSIGLRACVLVRGTSSCGNVGFLLIVAILLAGFLVGAALLRAWSQPDPAATSLLAVAVMSVVLMLVLIDVLESLAMIVVVPAVGAGCFLLSGWVTTTYGGPQTIDDPDVGTSSGAPADTEDRPVAT